MMNYIMFTCVFTYVGPTSAGECAICLGSTAQHRLRGGGKPGRDKGADGLEGGGGGGLQKNIRRVH
jgi:hypothetical protein